MFSSTRDLIIGVDDGYVFKVAKNAGFPTILAGKGVTTNIATDSVPLGSATFGGVTSMAFGENENTIYLTQSNTNIIYYIHLMGEEFGKEIELTSTPKSIKYKNNYLYFLENNKFYGLNSINPYFFSNSTNFLPNSSY